ncbi:MAG: dTDP-4-dehydrorhamnose 3,5-epimerase [Chitinophagaceae bacterium]
MELIQTELQDCFILKPTIHRDDRGYFFESYNATTFQKLSGKSLQFIQDNQAMSDYGTIRGLHFQRGEYAQAKLVRVLQGSILDVAIDLRKNSPSYLKHIAVELNEKNQLQLFVPRGFAHGYSVLEQNTVVAYKCDNVYHKQAESGLLYCDPLFNIDWQIPSDKHIISEKDKAWKTVSETEIDF